MTDESAGSKKKQKKVRQITVTLDEPIEWGDETIKEIVLTRPKAKHIEHLSDKPTLKELLMIAQKCAKVPKRVIDDLDSEDAMKIVEAVTDFLDSGQGTGVSRSYS